MPGRFISFEGGEGAGKSTQLRRVAAFLRERGHEIVVTREPGGTASAEFLRDILLSGTHNFTPGGEMLLHFAAREEHCADLVRPALAAGNWVLSDRFFDSTEAYQVRGQGADAAAFAALKALVKPHPDLTIILDVSEATAVARQAARGRAADRYDRLGPGFHARVADGFRRIAAAEPHRCALVNAEESEDKVTERILSLIEARLP